MKATRDLINTSWINCHNDRRYVVCFVGVNPNQRTHAKIVGYVDSALRYYWRNEREFFKRFKRETGTFVNKSKRMWNETECRNMVNAALLHLADENGGRLDISTKKLLASAEKMGAVVLAVSDDDQVLMITGTKTQ